LQVKNPMRILILFFVCNTLWHHTSLPTENFEDGHGATTHYNKKNKSKSSDPDIGKVIDKLNGIPIYYNGPITHVLGRNITSDGYNLGLKYQCVEFVKRYYYQYLNHKMPDSFGHAKDFFDDTIPDGTINDIRGLTQYTNPSVTRPELNDILIFAGDNENIYGHLAIVSKVYKDRIEIVQQNIGSQSRIHLNVHKFLDGWEVEDYTVIGWLRRN